MKKVEPQEKHERFPPLSTSLPTFLKDGCDAGFRQTIYGLLQVSALMLKAREYYGAYIGVSGPQYSMMVAIAELRETTVRDLSTKLHVSGPFITVEINKLIKAGYVAKRPDDNDRRSSLLSLTEEGVEHVKKVSTIRMMTNDAIFGSFDAADAQSLQRLVKALVRDLEVAVHHLESPQWKPEPSARGPWQRSQEK
ncbi:MarR family transcriptional regulator [Bosea sp. TND4EK4]|uniref:MarR family winged helix-turn-helix transcriptional regulator n=1 Tax=Bosea sp. TND4EK4 TaxID=1907408 RepID=UPI0009549418|nr:MarR family transcriptional regulator [Bosea sp. TND4EK4]SIR46015.1 transcriptional regulator, MarR family [Bosea sp. TND4EK4]